jgi:hypothetical protein
MSPPYVNDLDLTFSFSSCLKENWIFTKWFSHCFVNKQGKLTPVLASRGCLETHVLSPLCEAPELTRPVSCHWECPMLLAAKILLLLAQRL